MSNLVNEIISYWDSQPCNIKHSDLPIGSFEYFEAVKEKRYFVEPHIKRFAEFEQYSGLRVLEIGCGIATDGIEFARHGADYTGIDISSASIEIAKQRFETYNLNGSLLVANAAEDLSNLGTFDLVYSIGVLHHCPNINDIIDNVYNLLKPGGTFKFVLYAENSWKYAMIKQGLDQFEAQSGCPYADVYTKEKIHSLLNDKFTVNSIEQDHCFMYQVDLYKKGIYKLETWFEAMPDEIKATIRKELGWHLLTTATK